MPTGLEVYTSYGESTVSITDRITKVLYIGTVPVTGQTNTFTLSDPAFLHGTPFVHCHMSNALNYNYVGGTYLKEMYSCMQVSHILNGSTLTVTYGYTTAGAYSDSQKEPLFLVVGVY